MEEIRIKQGASLNLSFQFQNEPAPWDVTYVALTAQVRAPDGTLVANLPMVKQPELGLVTASVPDTSEWPMDGCAATCSASSQVRTFIPKPSPSWWPDR